MLCDGELRRDEGNKGKVEDEGGTIRGGRSRFKREIPVTGGPGLAKWTSTSSEAQHLEMTPGVILVPSCLQEFPAIHRWSNHLPK